MKVHYFNILLFALPLNILVNNQRNHKSPTSHTSKITTTRLLCECELYAPSNYDNDREMKEVMENFNKQTQQRFHEYDERMKTTRQKCKDNCEKEIQKIILKDKLEKQMVEQFSTLQTDIQNGELPECTCKKSMADKVEKDCLRCGYGIGTVAPTIGLIGSVAVGAWKPLALKATIDKALELYAGKITAAGVKAGQVAGKNALIEGLKALKIEELRIGSWESFIDPVDYTKVSEIVNIIKLKKTEMCGMTKILGEAKCEEIACRIGTSQTIVPKPPPDVTAIGQTVTKIVEETKGVAAEAAKDAEAVKKAAIVAVQEEAIDAATYNWYATIGYSVLAIIIIVLIMVIIYKILRYRRKKKMKKKLQYIKLLEE
ncbi:rifin PIR protein, putative [Plasmodium reichenowi]|uniref:Rifin PIR protein, putative n=1 Tax=Plasmodium reichenowi TaxID=5854 RepID=A0A2P9D3Y1_PLARE|nr:rifin PIR protein, putative [Plasmodium reichenowi]